MKRKVLWFDQGVTSGAAWAVWEPGEGRAHEQIAASIRDGSGGLQQIDCRDEDRGAWEMMMLISTLEPDVIGFERFMLFPGEQHHPDRDGIAPDRLEAMVRFGLWIASSTQGGIPAWDDAHVPFMPAIVVQQSSVMSVITDDRLRRWGMWLTPKKGGGPHAMDALRHLIVFARKEC